jgi:hypothetical protein
MIRRPVGGSGEKRGMARGRSGERSPGTRPFDAAALRTGDRSRGHAHSILGPDTHPAAPLSRFGASIPILHSPYGDDYPMNSLTTETTMGSR